MTSTWATGVYGRSLLTPVVKRVGWEDYYLGIADAVAVRADCTRRMVGALVVKDNSIISTGYNGSPPGEPGCLTDGACPRGRHYETPSKASDVMAGRRHCACGNLWPCDQSVKPGSSYDTGAGTCIALHAEQNALIRAGSRAKGAVLYCTEEPCEACMRLVRGAGIDIAVWYGGAWYRNPQKKSWLSSFPGPILKAWR